MTTLAEHFAANYALHPEFACDGQVPFDIDAGRLESFNTPFGALRRLSRPLRRRDALRMRGDCAAALSSVFCELIGQTRNTEEIAFLRELEFECRTRMLVELNFYVSRRVRAVEPAAGSPRSQSAVHGLVSDRHWVGTLSPVALWAIEASARADVRALESIAAQGSVGRAELSVNSGPGVTEVRRILNREFAASGLTAAVSAYFGTGLAVSGVALELSVPHAPWWQKSVEGVPRPPLTGYAHFDEDATQLKAIVYLSAVEPGNGPTSCYPHVYERLELNPLQELIGRVIANVGSRETSSLRLYYGRPVIKSMSSASFRAGWHPERARRHFMRLPSCLRFNTHLGWDALPDGDLERSLLDLEWAVLGDAGRFVVFDGARLLHRGGMVTQHARLALQVAFSRPRRAGTLGYRDATSIIDLI